MHELPPHLQSRPAAAPVDAAGPPPEPGKRPFYKRKRYLLPAAVLLLAMCGQDEDAGVTERPPAAEAAADAASTSTFDKARWLAANEATTTSNTEAIASTEAARKAAAEAAAKAKAEAEAAARAEAARVAAEQAAAAEAARVAAERAAAQEAARLEAERQAAEVQQPANVYYANCDAVRAAGAAPIRVGDPGYNRKLDRDGDGQGCGAD
jgi:colicin import membrane protein